MWPSGTRALSWAKKLAIFQLLTIANVQKLEVDGLSGQINHRPGGNVPRSRNVALVQCGKQVFSDSIVVPV